jgi:hypothetical protein
VLNPNMLKAYLDAHAIGKTQYDIALALFRWHLF